MENEKGNCIIRIKRRLEGDPGAPQILSEGELAYNEVDDTLYIGVSDTSSNILTGGEF